ncbi:MAG: hypothetical protein ACK5LR_03590 [Mangrovibacterium sp.]
MDKGEVVIYQSQNGDIKVDVQFFEETVWLTQEQMSQLFGKAKSTINEHIKNIYTEGELEKASTLQKFGNSEFQQKAPNIQLNGRELLTHAGRISHQQALNKSTEEYQRYKEQQKQIEKIA